MSGPSKRLGPQVRPRVVIDFRACDYDLLHTLYYPYSFSTDQSIRTDFSPTVSHCFRLGNVIDEDLFMCLFVRVLFFSVLIAVTILDMPLIRVGNKSKFFGQGRLQQVIHTCMYSGNIILLRIH